jgi:hypothetical protein
MPIVEVPWDCVQRALSGEAGSRGVGNHYNKPTSWKCFHCSQILPFAVERVGNVYTSGVVRVAPPGMKRDVNGSDDEI